METEEVPESRPEEGQSPVEPKEDGTTKFFIIAAAILISVGVLMFFLSIGQKNDEEIKKVTYSQFTFEYYAGLWNTQWQDKDKQVYNLRLHFNPYQVENVSIVGDSDWNAKQTTYITFDPEAKNLNYVALSAAELSLSLYNTFGISPVAACSSNTTEACVSRPIINCDNAPMNSTVIYIRDVSPTQITISKSCVIIAGTGPEVLRASEKAIYQWYGIIK